MFLSRSELSSSSCLSWSKCGVFSPRRLLFAVFQEVHLRVDISYASFPIKGTKGINKILSTKFKTLIFIRVKWYDFIVKGVLCDFPATTPSILFFFYLIFESFLNCHSISLSIIFEVFDDYVNQKVIEQHNQSNYAKKKYQNLHTSTHC